MLQNIFTTSPLAWAGLIALMVALPILIHLINLLRHQRVKWAAMDFLLKSYKKRRNWVWLKQLLLLASRIAVLILGLLMLAQIGCESGQISNLVGSRVTHHYVLIDDSFSMDDRVAGAAVFDRARSALTAVTEQLVDSRNNRCTILRFSKAVPGTSRERASVQQNSADLESNLSIRADMNADLADSTFLDRAEDARDRLTVSQLAVNPAEVLETANQLIQTRENEDPVVYVVSDFRSVDWSNNPDVVQKLETINNLGAKIHFIKCVGQQRDNLAVVSLKPLGNIRVAGFPAMMEVAVQNFGSTIAEKVQVMIDSFEYGSNEMVPDGDELPTVFIESIKPGEVVKQNFLTFFNSPGKHVVSARLEADSLSADNQSWNVTEFATSAKILVIDGPDQKAAKYVTKALEPGGLTGLQCEVRTKDFLRDIDPNELSTYDVIYVLDIESFDESAVKNMEAFVAAGGGIAFFAGPNVNRAFYSQRIYRGGEGLLPLPLNREVEFPELTSDPVPDVQPVAHPIMNRFLGLKNSPLDQVQIARAIQPPIEWVADDKVAIAATVRGQKRSPLIATKKFGNGNCCVVLTQSSGDWNTWSTNRTFPLLMLFIEDWLASGKYASASNLVGSPIEFQFPADNLQSQVTFVTPSSDGNNRNSIQLKSDVDDSNPELKVAVLPAPSSVGSVINTGRSGVYEAYLEGSESIAEVRRWALNVDTKESQLALATRAQLAAIAGPISATVVEWNQFSAEQRASQTTSLSKILLVILVVLLVLEQILAYSTSFHPKRFSLVR